MEKIHYCEGTCSRVITFTLEDDDTISNVSFAGGCDGNAKGVATLVEGMKAKDIIAKLEHIKCGNKGTSCPAQLAFAIKDAIAERNELYNAN